ncbi:tRNA lysidine(34) synthetase TilS [Paramagnetospirillum magneticum]|uniref:tRNA(Ile)-lysidine synthase n=1 Tax=Paramagnetospirillum magneticum (strain ATCC 700264 / AMB-1) TaxID=342108 RepID=Q2W2B4_PARM1|nr:tRNA lysidine(34) synthetase TilS [Paramagnetospirillum magneticum]BAE52011.1 Predicted ATPase of the PP-loop superfamily implicated in cell cycle control [Paramagnetospirillum magneticum AMB-1]
MSVPPLSSDDFSRLMAPLGPFEAAPRLAVAVSGGADSLALALLAADWAKARGGEVLALTVDHRLRPESAAEAARVGAWLARDGISHRILAWEGDKPAADLQAAARAARYGLLGEACAAEGILHLALAHHQDDQAETLLLRLGRGSGLEGLGAMAAERPTSWGRLLRPLLPVPRVRLEATLRHRGQEWTSDPSNRNPAFARVRLRHLAGDLAAEGMTPRRLAETAGRLARAQAAVDSMVAEAAARHVTLDPAGFGRLRPEALAGLPDEVGLRLLAGLLLSVGGEAHTPRLERLERLHATLCGGLEAARTLAGCRIVPQGDSVVLCREPARVAPPLDLVPGSRIRWDGRFEAVVAGDAPPGLRLGALGPEGRRKVLAAMGRQRPEPVPTCAIPTLPALYHERGILAAPHLGYNREGAGRVLVSLRASPLHVLTVFACAGGNRHYL